MRRAFVILGLACALLLGVPLQTQAANLPTDGLIPKCDETVYVIQNIGDTEKVISIPADQYDTTDANGVKQYAKENWNVINYTTSEHCGFNSFLELFVNLFNWGLYVLSILALFFFFLGGGTLMLSGGSEERVRVGKAILVNTVIGLVIALSSWVIVNLTVNTLRPEGKKLNGIAVLIGNQPWFRVDSSNSYVTCSLPATYPCKNGGGAVKTVQTQLFNFGCYTNPGSRADEVDGNFGPKTRDAWWKLQDANHVTRTSTLSGAELLTTPCVTDL